MYQMTANEDISDMFNDLFKSSDNEFDFHIVPRGDGPFREKYRPQKLAELVPTCQIGQLRNIISTPSISQVFLCEGITGTGKTTCARILAKAFICTHPNAHEKPCLDCDNCNSFDKSFDVTYLNAANQNKIEDVRELVDGMRYGPAVYPKKIYILDEVQRLTSAAQQVLLTELEEPLPYLLIFLCTTSSKDLEKPLRDRALTITFEELKPAQARAIVKQVAEHENISIPDDLIESFFQQAKGSIRALLNNIQLYINEGYDPRKIDDEDASPQVQALFKAITSSNWSDLSKLLKNPRVRSEAEALRMGLENYFRAVILKTDSLSDAIKLSESLMRIIGSSYNEPSIVQYNNFVLKCTRACAISAKFNL